MLTYAQIAWFNFLKYLTYPTELLGAFLRKLGSVTITILFWLAIQRSGGVSKPIAELVAYFLIVEGMAALVMFSPYRMAGELNKAIKTGRFSSYLLQPLPVLRNFYSFVLGARGGEIIFGVIGILAGLFIIRPTILGLALVVPFILIGASIALAFNILIGTLAFYVVDASGFKNGADHITSYMTGRRIPFYVLPVALQPVALATPFAYMGYIPTQVLFATKIDHSLLIQGGIGLMWVMVVSCISLVAWKRGLKRYEATGL